MAIKNAESGSELGSVGLAETQVFFVWPDESMKRAHDLKYQHCEPELKKTTS